RWRRFPAGNNRRIVRTCVRYGGWCGTESSNQDASTAPPKAGPNPNQKPATRGTPSDPTTGAPDGYHAAAEDTEHTPATPAETSSNGPTTAPNAKTAHSTAAQGTSPPPATSKPTWNSTRSAA